MHVYILDLMIMHTKSKFLGLCYRAGNFHFCEFRGFVAICESFLCKIWGHGIIWRHHQAIHECFFCENPPIHIPANFSRYTVYTAIYSIIMHVVRDKTYTNQLSNCNSQRMYLCPSSTLCQVHYRSSPLQHSWYLLPSPNWSLWSTHYQVRISILLKIASKAINSS